VSPDRDQLRAAVALGRRRRPHVCRGRALLRPLAENGAEVGARAFVAGLQLREGERRRPRVVGVMIASIDGRATIEGRSVKLGHPDDRALLREMRTGVDAVLAGSRTLIAERYATLLDEDQRALRRADGRAPHPIIATVSRRLDAELATVPVLSEDVPVLVYSEREGELAGAEVVTCAPLDLAVVLDDLGARGVRAVSCEGGPSLLRALVAQGCLDDLLITVSPRLVAGDGPTPLTGAEVPGAPRLTLAHVHRADDHLFLHYTA